MQKHLVLTHDTVIGTTGEGRGLAGTELAEPVLLHGLRLAPRTGPLGRAGLSPMDGLTGRNDESRTISQSWIRRIDPVGQGAGELVGMQTAVAGSRLGSSRIYPGGDSASLASGDVSSHNWLVHPYALHPDRAIMQAGRAPRKTGIWSALPGCTNPLNRGSDVGKVHLCDWRCCVFAWQGTGSGLNRLPDGEPRLESHSAKV